MNHASSGRHFLVEFYNCQVDAKIFDDLDTLQVNMYTAAMIGMTNVVGNTFHKFKPNGLTGILLLSESHFSVHSFYDEKKLFIDVFTCGDKAQPQKIINFMERVYKPYRKSLTIATRN